MEMCDSQHANESSRGKKNEEKQFRCPDNPMRSSVQHRNVPMGSQSLRRNFQKKSKKFGVWRASGANIFLAYRLFSCQVIWLPLNIIKFSLLIFFCLSPLGCCCHSVFIISARWATAFGNAGTTQHTYCSRERKIYWRYWIYGYDVVPWAGYARGSEHNE